MSFSSARTRPNVSPTTMMSPTLSVPVWTSAVATGPRPLSSLASTIVPIASRFGLALSSWRSATSRIISISSSSPIRVLAETGTSGTSPPYSSTTMPASVSSVLTRSGFASGLSILLSAMMIGTLAALAWLIASSVWGMTPSSAATTTTAMSVTLRAAGAHRGERLVTRRIEEDDALAVVGDLARADVLGDAAALAGRDLGRPDGVEQARLAVVDVTHDGHDRGARLEQRRIVLLEEDLLGRLGDLAVAVLVGAAGARRPRSRPPRSRARRRRATRCRGRRAG